MAPNLIYKLLSLKYWLFTPFSRLKSFISVFWRISMKLTQKQKETIKDVRRLSMEFHACRDKEMRYEKNKQFGRLVRTLPFDVAEVEVFKHWRVPKKYW
jgi:hypothetical protein